MKLFDTLQNNGDGATIDPLKYIPLTFRRGYAVGLTDNAFNCLTIRATRQNAKKLKAYAKKLNLKNYYFGYWRDSKTGKNFFDLSIVVMRKAEALNIGRIFGQKAIFDFNKMVNVYI